MERKLLSNSSNCGRRSDIDGTELLLRILHLSNRMSNLADGIINVVVDLATWQARNGHEVVVASLGGSYEPLLHEHGVRTVRLDMSQRSVRGLVSTTRQLRALAIEFRPDVIHSHTLAPAAIAAVASPRTHRVSTVHNEYQKGSYIMGLSHTVVCVSAAIKKAMDAHWLCRGKTTVILNSVIGTPRRPAIADRRSIALAGTSILALGSITERKGSDLLLAAFAGLAETHPDAHLYFVGNLDSPELVEPYLTVPWMDQIHFEGFQPDPSDYLSAADIFVMASRRDPFPLAMLEARQAGIASIASDADGLPEALDHGRSGLLFANGSVVALREALLRYLDDVPLRRRMAEAAGTGLERYHIDRMNRDYIAAYQRR